MSHVIGKSKAELLAMARSHQEGKKGIASQSLLKSIVAVTNLALLSLKAVLVD